MKLSVKVYNSTFEGKIKAMVSVYFNDCFVIKGFKIIDGKNGLFIANPSKKNGEGEFVDMAHPVTKEFREELYSKIRDEYSKHKISEGNDII